MIFASAACTPAPLAGADFKPERFVEQPVLLTGSREVLATKNGREIAHCALVAADADDQGR